VDLGSQMVWRLTRENENSVEDLGSVFPFDSCLSRNLLYFFSPKIACQILVSSMIPSEEVFVLGQCQVLQSDLGRNLIRLLRNSS